MTTADAVRRLDEIESIASDDPEAAHSKEDGLFVAVLQAVATGQVEGCTPAELAELALTAKQIQFERWAG